MISTPSDIIISPITLVEIFIPSGPRIFWSHPAEQNISQRIEPKRSMAPPMTNHWRKCVICDE